MDNSLDCIPCLLRQSLEAARFVTGNKAVHEQVLRHILQRSLELDLSQPPPLIGQEIHRKLRELTGNPDPYRQAKDRFNELVMDFLPFLENQVKASADPMCAAVRLAIAANVIDLGANGSLSDDEVRESLKHHSEQPFTGELGAFRQAIADSANVLYLADNAGEIAVDRLLIQRLLPRHVTVSVRGGPVINDATTADAIAVRMEELAEVIDNGSDAPGTILDDCSDSFRERFRMADMIIAKGQGNYESLSDTPGNIFFLFKVKCLITAGHTGLPKGTHALLRSRTS